MHSPPDPITRHGEARRELRVTNMVINSGKSRVNKFSRSARFIPTARAEFQ